MSYNYGFEKLAVWEEARMLVSEIYKMTTAFPDHEKYGLTNQIRRSAVSIASNIAEGAARFSNKEQKRYYEMAYSSGVECLNQLIIANDLEFISNTELESLRQKISKITFQLNQLHHSNKVSEPESPYSLKKPQPSSQPQSQPKTQPPSQLQTQPPPSPPQLITKNGYTYHKTAVIDENSDIGVGTKIWHFSHIMLNCKLGKKCNIGQNVVVSSDVILGDNVKVQNNVSIYTGVTCEDDVFLGPSMVFTNVINPRSGVNRRGKYSKTLVKKGASIGANATIVCGNDIGAFAFIGAGAVVTKYVLPYALVVGNPAKQIGWMSEYGHRLLFDEKGIAICKESGEEYKLEEGKVEKV